MGIGKCPSCFASHIGGLTCGTLAPLKPPPAPQTAQKTCYTVGTRRNTNRPDRTRSERQRRQQRTADARHDGQINTSTDSTRRTSNARQAHHKPATIHGHGTQRRRQQTPRPDVRRQPPRRHSARQRRLLLYTPVTDDSPPGRPAAAHAGRLNRKRITHADRQHARHDPGQAAARNIVYIYI